MNLTAWLEQRLTPGRWQMGEVLVEAATGAYELRHVADEGRDDLLVFHDPSEARRLARLNEAGAYRPLKTAPDLRRGWLLRLASARDLRTALDSFYPAMVGMLAAPLATVPLRETLARQSGMYAITRKITDAQAQEMIGDFCGGCVKTILWSLAPDIPVESLRPDKRDSHTLPMLCHEACHLLVAQAREIVKSAA